MSCVVDLASRRVQLAPSVEIVHPAGVRIPFDESAFVEFLIPEVRGDISSGSYSADLIRHVSSSVFPGDRALVIGAGLGIVSTLIAQTGHVERALAVEADTRLIPFLKRVHNLNGVGWVETLHGVLSTEVAGRTPFFPGHDIRDSGLLPGTGAGRPFLVPCLDLNLVLADERISLIVCDIPGASMHLLADAELGRVERVLVNCATANGIGAGEAELVALMQARGFVARSWDHILLFERTDEARTSAVDSSAWEKKACVF